MPTITKPGVIDGTTQPDYAGAPLIVLDGSRQPTVNPGLILSAGRPDRARPLFEELLQTHPAQAGTIRQVIKELERDYPVFIDHQVVSLLGLSRAILRG